jgi:uncharacterized membrane protein YbhN (UPF0104 family)
MSDSSTLTEDSSMAVEPPKRNWKRFAIRIGGSLVILALLFTFLPREKLLKALSGFSTELWLAGISTYLCLHLIGVAKWRMLINTAGAGLNFSQAVRCYYYGLFGNTFLPSVVGGDVIRAGLALKMCRSKSGVLMGSVVDRTIDSLGLAAVAGIGALLIPAALEESSRNIFWGFAALIFMAVIVLVVLMYFLPARRFPFKIRRKLVKIREAVRSLLKNPTRVLIAFIAVMVLQTAQVVMNLWLGRLAMMVKATFLMWLFVWPLAKLAAMVPITQGGIGVREAAQAALFSPFGISMEKAVATGLIFQAIIISGNLLGGVLATFMGRFVPAAGARVQPVSQVKSSHQLALNYALIAGGILFFIANTLVIAHGTGYASNEVINWMNAIPGYSASFTGSLIGFIYGAGIGYLLGRVSGKLLNR